MWEGRQRTLFVTPEQEPSGWVSRRLLVPLDDDIGFLQQVNGALALLLDPKNYTETPGGLTVNETVQHFQVMFSGYLEGYDMLGMVLPTARETLPPTMLWCDGALYQRADYPALYDAIEPIFRIDADSFIVPDLRSKFVLGAVPASVHPPGGTGGEYSVTLTASQMPVHTHVQNPHAHNYSTSIAVPVRNNSPMTGGAGAIAAQNNSTPNAVYPVSAPPMNDATAVNQNAGGGDSHNNMPPYQALRYAIIAR